MTLGLARWAGLAALSAAILAVHLGTAPSAAQDTQPKPKDPLLPQSPDDHKTGFFSCKKCHNYSSKDDAAKDDYAIGFKSNEFVLLSEGTTWKQKDPHSNAHKVLESKLGEQMSEILKYKVTEAPQCLTCHAIDVTPTAPLKDKKFVTDDGVTCNACHGIRPPWQTAHYEDRAKKIPWRTMAPEEKEKAGLRNLRDPVVKAQLCASCHVGSAELGRVVTHEMYAAGHPPLPPFEIGAFMETQPKHWGFPVNPELKYFTDGGFETYAGADFAKAHPNWQWELYRFHKTEALEGLMARSIAAGAIASLQAEMRMVAADAAHADAAGLDFARFDCYACHHDLKVPSERQARGYGGLPPGRPPLKAWIGALPSVVVEHAVSLAPLADTAKGFAAKWDAVQKAAVARPFGDPKALTAAAAEMDKWCDEFLAKSAAGGKPLYTPEESKKLLAAIGKAATSPRWTADPEAAMHLTWAYVTLREQSGALAADKVKALGETIPVRVRFEPYTSPKGEPTPAGQQIAPRLDLFRKYRPADFIPKFQDLMGK